MDKKEELQYLIQLLLDASSWHLDESDMELDPIRVEVKHRISVLTGESDGEAGPDGLVHNKKAPGQKPEDKPWHDPDHPNCVRVSLPDGKKKWVPLAQTRKVPCKHSKTGWKYVLA